MAKKKLKENFMEAGKRKSNRPYILLMLGMAVIVFLVVLILISPYLPESVTGEAKGKKMSSEPLAEQCTDGTDNDGNGQIDCADFKCNGKSCGPPGCICLNEKKTETYCDNGIDDDGDGMQNCFDLDCAGKKNIKEGVCCDPKNPSIFSCPVGFTCLGVTCEKIIFGANNEICTNKKDDNNNGLVDCADSACKDDPACVIGRLCSKNDVCPSGYYCSSPEAYADSTAFGRCFKQG